MKKYIYVIDVMNKGYYSFVATNRKKPVKLIIQPHEYPELIKTVKCYIAAALRTQQKTAGVLVYRKAIDTETNEYVWIFQDSCDVLNTCLFDRYMSDEAMNKLIDK